MTEGNPTIKAQPEVVAHHSRGELLYGDKQALFLRADMSHEKVFEFVLSKLCLEQEFIHLPALGISPWKVLSRLLSPNLHELELMRSFSQYADYATDRFADSLIPIALLTPDPTRYLDKEVARGVEIPEAAVLGPSDSGSALIEYARSRTGAQLPSILLAQAGSGYMRSHQPSEGEPRLKWHLAELNNGDHLLLVGYEWYEG